MYCRMCGRKIGDTDLFCQFCGTPTGRAESTPASAEAKEEIIFNPPYEDRSQLTEEEELKDYISENEIEEAQKKEIEDKEETEAPEPAKDPEFTWNLYEFPTEKKKTEEVEFNWNTEDYGQPEQKEAEAKNFEEELFQEIREDSNRIKEQNIDRFFTFSRKSEEFQELLDKEYEKFRMRTAPATKYQEEQPIKETAEEQQDEAAPHQEIQIEPEMPEAIEAAEVEAVEPEIAEPEEVEAVEAEIAEPEEVEAVETEIAEPEDVKSEIAGIEEAPRAGHISEMELARAQYFGEDLIRDNESIRKKLTLEEPEKMKTVEDYIEEEKAAENYIETPETEEEQEEPEGGRTESAAVAPTDHLTATIGEAGEKEETEKPRRSIGQVVLAIIAVILVIEIAILGIRYFAPDSSAAKAIGNAQTKIFNTVAGWFDGDGTQGGSSDDQEALPDDGDKTDPDTVGEEEPPADTETNPPADPNPMADKAALVSSQLENNKNIEQVKANEALAWKRGENYGLSDINNSKPISNNIWQAPESGDPIYYDKSVVGAIIAFDSKWIDYVNSGDKSVLSLLKKDSEAYRKSVNYSKVGKIKETFKLLEIGEIRQGANGFYIWVHEEIGATENGKTSDMKYNWIYYLEPVDGQMKIVNYYHFK